MKKHTLSKDTYFERNTNMTKEFWEAFKAAHPQPSYTGEICWELHDSMIERGKPASDAAVIKTLLKEVSIEFEAHTEKLHITSDLTGKDIVVVEIEDDELLEQLEAAGARVLYFTSNPNYGFRVPEKYFSMYPENYDAYDYPTTDKRNLFNGKNIIVKYVMFSDYKKQYNNMLRDTIKENNMIVNKVIMNPPYAGSLHLDILSTTLDVCRANNPDCEVVSIQPARWLEDPLAKYKQGSDAIKYKKSITEKISKLQLVDATTACESFNIMNATDLGIYTFNNTVGDTTVNKQAELIEKLLAKITTMKTLADMVDEGKVDGYRCEVKELTSGTGGHNLGNYDSSKIADVNIIWGPYTNGYTEDGAFFTEARQKNQFTKQYFRFSIATKSAEENKNFMLSCNTKFYRRLVQLLKCDVHAPIKFLPYMEDYSHVWTDEEYCKFFGLDEEESKFMCRTVEDYRVKDFINYIQLDKED